MSRSVTIPISRSLSPIGMEPMSCSRINFASSVTGVSGLTQSTPLCIASLTFMADLRCWRLGALDGTQRGSSPQLQLYNDQSCATSASRSPPRPGQRLEDAQRGDRYLAQLDAVRAQRVVHRIGDRGGGTYCATFPDSLLSELGVRRRRLHVEDADLGHLPAARQQIVGERRGQRLPLAVERHLLEQRRADALLGAALDLAIDDHRVHQHAGVLRHHVVENLDPAGLRIDGNERGMRGAGVDAGEPLWSRSEEHTSELQSQSNLVCRLLL